MKSIEILAEELGQKLEYVQNVVNLAWTRQHHSLLSPDTARNARRHGRHDAAESGDPPDLRNLQSAGTSEKSPSKIRAS